MRRLLATLQANGNLPAQNTAPTGVQLTQAVHAAQTQGGLDFDQAALARLVQAVPGAAPGPAAQYSYAGAYAPQAAQVPVPAPYGYQPGYNPQAGPSYSAAPPAGFPPTPVSTWQQQQGFPAQAAGSAWATNGASQAPPPGPRAYATRDYGYSSGPPTVVQGGLDSVAMVMKRGKGRQAARARDVCKYYKSRRGCDWGDKCSFLHEG